MKFEQKLTYIQILILKRGIGFFLNMPLTYTKQEMHFIKTNRIDEEDLRSFEVRDEIIFFDLLLINYAIQWLETKKLPAIDKRQRKSAQNIEWKKEWGRLC